MLTYFEDTKIAGRTGKDPFIDRHLWSIKILFCWMMPDKWAHALPLLLSHTFKLLICSG